MGLFDIFKKHKITNDKWAFYYTYDEAENEFYISLDLSYQDPKDQIGFKGELFIRICLPQHRVFDGIAIPEEHEFQNIKEEELCESLIKSKVKCFQVGRLHSKGEKHYIFEYNDLEGFQKEFVKWKASFSGEYTLELKLLKPFEYYREILPDKYAWQQIMNNQVIEKLLEAGSNESKEHFIEHGIYGNLENFKLLYKEIKEEGYQVIEMEDDLLEVGYKSSLEIEEITDQTDYLIYIADKYNCTYDGWFTAVVK